MNKRRSTLLMISLMFFFALTAVGCTQTGTDTMSGSSAEMSNGSMENSMGNDMNTMDERKRNESTDKNMDTMGAEKMDGNMKDDMQDKMK